MRRIFFLFTFICLALGLQAQSKAGVRKNSTAKKTTVTKKSTPEVHKIIPMTKDQETEYTKNMVDSLKMNGTSWERVVALPGLTKSEIYRFSKEYMGKSFTNWAKNIQVDDADNGKLVCMGAMQTLVTKEQMPGSEQKCFIVYNGITRQILTFDIKDERVRVRGEGFAWTGKSTMYMAGNSSPLSNYYGEKLLTMSMLIGGEKNIAEGEAKLCDALRLGALQFLTELRNYSLKAKLDDDF